MPPRESTSGEGGQRKAVHFTYVATTPGKPWHAYIAGPCKWFDCHCKGRTKPCVHRITAGELVCPLWSPMDPWESTGFLPLWREVDWAPVMVIVHENVKELVEKHKHRARVLIGREEGQTAGVWVIPPLKAGGSMSSTDERKTKPQDVWPTLVRVWKNAALAEWDLRDRGITRGGCITAPETPAVLPMHDAVRLRVSADVDHLQVNNEFTRIVKAAASRNGQHKFPPNDEPPGEGV